MKKLIFTTLLALTVSLSFSQTWLYQYKQEGSNDSIMYLLYNPPPNNLVETPIYTVFADKRFTFLSDTMTFDSCKVFKLPFPSNEFMKGDGGHAVLSSLNVTTALGYTPIQTEADGSSTNEIQSLSISTNTLSISGGNSVVLPTYLSSEVDGSVTNEIELPTQTGNSGKYLTTNGSATSWATVSSTSPGNDKASAYASGTVYTLTTTSQKVDFGTNDPSITIPAAGTYLILTNIKLGYAGVTTILNRNIDLKLRRTNNTASDITNSNTSFTIPILGTAITGTAGDCDVPALIYTTSNSNDVIELWGSISAGLATGTAQVQEASIVVVRIY